MMNTRQPPIPSQPPAVSVPTRLATAAARATARTARIWFEMTRSEQKSIAIVLFLAILGLLVRTWRLAH